MKHNLKILNVLPLTVFFFIILSSGIVLYQLKVDKRIERSLTSQLIGKNIPETLIPKENFIEKINNLEIVDFAAIVDGDILVIKGKIYNNDFFSRLSPLILISGYNSNNEVYDFFKLKAENQIIKPGTYNYFRYETTN